MIRDRFTLIKEYVKGKTVLDFGSQAQQPNEKYLLKNRPNLFAQMKGVAEEVVGVDLYGDGKEVIRGDCTSIRLNRKFDVVVMGSIINHIENHQDLIDNAVRHMKPGGHLIITTQNMRSWRAFLKQPIDDPVGTGHVSVHTFETLKNLLNRHDLNVVDYAYYYGDKALYPFPMRLFGTFQQTMAVVAKK